MGFASVVVCRVGFGWLNGADAILLKYWSQDDI